LLREDIEMAIFSAIVIPKGVVGGEEWGKISFNSRGALQFSPDLRPSGCEELKQKHE